MSRIRKFVGVAAIAACGPEEPNPPAELEEICGAEGPHRLLALDGDEALVWAGIRRIGDRVYISVGTGEGEPIFGWPQPATPKLYSTGPCGEEPLLVAEDVVVAWDDERWPGQVLGCRGLGGDLVKLDPSGASEPTLLVPDGCGAPWTDHGLVRFEQVDEATARVLFYPYPDQPDGPIEPIVLLDAVRGDSYPFGSVFADEVLALDLSDDIVRVSLPDGEVTIEQSGVLGFEATERWLLWQDRASAVENSDDPRDISGDILLRDRETGDDVFLDHRVFRRNWPQLSDDRVLMMWLGQRETLLVELPSQTRIEVPDGHFPKTRIADGRWLTEAGFGGPWYLLDPDGTTTLVTGDGGVAGWGEEHLSLLRIAAAPQADMRAEGEFWRYPFDGSEPELAARRATMGRIWWLDGRIVTPVEVDERWIGRLVIVDPETLAERTIDERVHGRVGYVDLSGDREPDALVYVVRDGERSGVWVARPGE